PPRLLDRILADPERPRIEADLRPVTVLFAQVVGLEAAAEALPPALAAQAAQTYVASVQEAIEQFGGVVNKLDVADEGIKLVAILGAPVAYENHPEGAAHAALEMHARLDSVKEKIANLLATTGHRPPTTDHRESGIEKRETPDAASASSLLTPRSSNQSSVVG